MFNIGKQGILRITFFVSVLVIMGKALGFAREMYVASLYGSTLETDAYFLAQNMPGMLFPSVCNSLSTAFIAIYSKKKQAMSLLEERKYVYGVLLGTCIVSVILSIVGMIIAPVAVSIFAPGFSSFQHKLATSLTIIVMSAFVVMMLQYMYSAIANVNERFIGVHIAALLFNITIIMLLFVNGEKKSIYFLTYSFVLGQVVQVIVLAIIAYSSVPFTIKISFNEMQRSVKEIMFMAVPILIGSAAYQINAIIDKVLTSFLEEGAVSALSYSHTLTSLIIGIFVTTLSTVIFPYFGKLYAKGELLEFKKKIEESVLILETILIPISIIVMFVSKEIVRIVFGHGEFGDYAVTQTSNALLGYAFVFVGTGMIEILTRAFYAIGDSKTPVKSTLIGVLANLVFSCILFRIIGIMGVALGTTLGTLASSIIIYKEYRKKIDGSSVNNWIEFFKMIVPACVEFIILFMINECLVLESSLIKVSLYSLIGFGVYVIVALMVSNRLRIFASGLWSARHRR